MGKRNVNLSDQAQADCAGAAGSIPYAQWWMALQLKNSAFFQHAIATGKTFQAHKATGVVPLRLAALLGADDICRLLIESGSDVNEVTNLGSPLSGAASQGRIATCRLLVAAGADPSFTPDQPPGDYLTPFQRAVFQGKADVVRFFLEEAGQNPDQTSIAGSTMLELAQSHPHVVQELLSWQTRAVLNQAMKAKSRRRRGGVVRPAEVVPI